MRFQGFEIELNTVTGPLRRQRKSFFNAQRIFDVAIQAETMGLEIRAIRRRREALHRDIMGTVGGDG